MRTSMLSGASALVLGLLLATNAAAQDVQTDTGQEAADTSVLEELVITGSRIKRSDYVAESPIVTLSAASIDARGPATIDQLFNQTPQFAASNANSGSSPARQGRNNANLRGLGIQRTLVLLDGRRTQPSDALGAVDLNTISPGLIENVEVITGGASAIYGSDAVAGVVNFRLKRNFTGVEMDAQYGQSSRGDAAARSVNLTMGGNLAEDRGNVVLALSYFDRDGAYRASRPFFVRSGIASALQGGAIVSDASNLPTQAALNAVFATKYGTSAPARNTSLGYNSDGTLFTTATPILNLKYPEGEPYITDQGRVGFPLGNTLPLQTPVERYGAFARANYALTSNIEVYGQFNHTEYTSTYSRPGWSAGSTAPLAQIPLSNPFVSADLRAIAASRPNPTAPLNFTFNTSRLGRTAYDFSYDLNEFLGGVRGKLPYRDLSWDAYASYGTTKATEATSGFVDINAWNTLINAADGGASICPGGFNPFLPADLEVTPGQAGCFNYLNRTVREKTDLTQQVVEGTLQGGLFDLPAGELRFAAGGGYRRSTYTYEPANERANGTVWPVQLTGASAGAYNVTEFFGELFIPVVRDLPLIKELNVDVAYRYSDYNLIGGVNTYKASVDWRLVDSLRVRGGYQRAIRAPSLAELFSPPERASSGLASTASGGGDPCDYQGRLRNPGLNPNADKVRALCIAQGVNASIVDIYRFVGSSVSGVNAGNTTLKQESTDTFTAGIVWQSGFKHPLLRRLSASVDFYDIKVDNAIGVITSSVGLNRCFNSDGASNPNYDPTNYYCTLTTRNSNGGIETQQQPTLNLAKYETSGLDFQADWRIDLEDTVLPAPGAVTVNLIVSKLLSYKIQNIADAPFVDYKGTIGNGQIDSGAISFPEWKVAASATYTLGKLDVTALYRWYDSMTNAVDAGTSAVTSRGVAIRQYVDLTAAYRLNDKTVLRAGVQNVFDQEPPVWTGAGATDLGLYDLVQRRFFVGVKRRF